MPEKRHEDTAVCRKRHRRLPQRHTPVHFYIHLFNKSCTRKKNIYDVTRLAALYFPESTEKNARRRFLKVLRSEKDLWLSLEGLHLKTYQRSFTPRQYELIIDTLGKPEQTDEDFSEWPT